jgi:D-beta-D-heptose 7-phosphate kinase / D-beta-D-heptose 1-phosphate adenosyltransferase
MTKMGDLSAVLRRFPGQRILVLGDVMLDRYWWGDASRLSPEAPVPVVRKQRSTVRPGGAANTAANLTALGAAASLIGITGVDGDAGELIAALGECDVSGAFLIAEASRPTTSKTRVIALHQQIVRVDHEDTRPISGELEAAAMQALAARLEWASAIVISDYAKGFLTPALLKSAIERARRAGKPVFVDPKGADHQRYSGCTLMKPNRLELGILTGMPVRNHEETEVAGNRLSAAMPGTMILVTESAEGMTLFCDGRAVERVTSSPRQVFDVTGAGDTVLAAISLGISAGASYRDAMELAMEAAAIAIGVVGTTAVTLQQMETALAE